MAKTYRPRKVDDNQNEIVKALVACGFSVAVTNIGDGFPDLVVARGGGDAKLVEVKNLEGKAKNRKEILTPDQQKFHREWRGRIYIVTSPQDAITQLT